MITIRCTRSRGPRGFSCLHDFRRGPVNVAVITLERLSHTFEFWNSKMKLKFGLIWLFVLTAIVAIASSLSVNRQKAYAKHQETLALELSKLEGTWQESFLGSEHDPTRSFTFTDPRIELLRPGVLRYTYPKGGAYPKGGVFYAIYKWSGANIIFHRADWWCQCPKDFDDMWPDVSWDAPPEFLEYLYSAKTRVHRYELRRVKVVP